jgi:uncharacterized protein
VPISYRAAQNLIKRGEEARLRAALQSGLDPNLENQNGWSLLMLAALEGSVPLCQLLLESGANINAKNRKGETALSIAAHKGHLPLLTLLRDKGASLDCMPHGVALIGWLRTASDLPQQTLAEVLQALSA